MKSHREVLEDLLSALDDFMSGEKPGSYRALLLAKRRARSRLNHKDTLESAYNRLEKESDV